LALAASVVFDAGIVGAGQNIGKEAVEPSNIACSRPPYFPSFI
jgi:hypothetical protein